MKRTIRYRRAQVEVLEAKRVASADRTADRYCYELRHGDDTVLPRTIENHVLVNFWGTAVSSKPLLPPGQTQFMLGRLAQYQFAFGAKTR